MDKYIGQLLDNRYEILEVIGTGGMAYVYKARCHRLNRLVAVKILKDEYSKDADFKRRFHAESQAVAMLSHPNIVSVYDVSKTGPVDYIVMELIDGMSLKQYMQKKGQLGWREALHFGTQIAKALEHAHSRGIIHRDIKPHNIMILRDGSVKVADFGIARFTSSQNTLTQEALGSVHYISPEQAKGSRVDYRSDIYSLGVVLYEMLTSRLPYDGDTPVAVAIQHINSKPVTPREIDPEIPVGFEQICLKAMCSDLSKRYESATALLEDLEQFRQNPDIVFGEPETVNIADAPTRTINTAEVLEQAQLKAAEETRLTRQERREQEHPSYSRKNSSSSRLPIVLGAVCLLLVVLGIAYFLWSFFLADMFATPGQVTVPTLVGLPYDDVIAAEEYSSYNIVEGSARESSDTVAEGFIISQEPVANRTIREDAQIKVVVSKGPSIDYMPQIINSQYQTAKLELEGLDVTLNIVPSYAYSTDYLEGQVISTDPAAGTTLHNGDTVSVVISQGQEIRMAEVPTLVGVSEEQAVDLIKQAGLVPGLITKMENELAEGMVFYQSLTAGTEVKEGTSVNFHVSLGAQETSPSPSPDGEESPSPSPDEEPPEESPEPTPEQLKPAEKPVKINLPEGEGTVSVVLKLDDVTIMDEIIDKALGSVTKKITGIGVQTLDVYYDGVLSWSQEIDFAS